MSITDTYGISGQYEQGLFQQGITPGSNPMGIQTDVAKAQALPVNPTANVGNLENELAMIQALRASAPSGGIGETIGGVVGGGAGALTGNPKIAAIAGGAGKAVGGVVDYMINSKAQKRAEAKELKARRALINKEKARANADTIKANRQRLRGIAESVEQDRMSEKERIAKERQANLDRMMMGLQNKAQYNDFIKNKLLASRSI